VFAAASRPVGTSALTPAAAAEPLRIAARRGANANVSLVARGRFAAMAWGVTAAGATDIYVAVSRDGGRAFSTPVRINGRAGGASLSGEQPPRIALVPGKTNEPSIVVGWTAKADAGTRLIASRSDDGGRSFAPPSKVTGSDASGNRGWESIATRNDGSVVAVWLDHREMAAHSSGDATGHAAHQHGGGAAAADGAERAQLSQLFFGGVTKGSAARPLTSGVCYCCKTALATGSDGAIYTAWRHVYPGSIRDIAFMMSADGGQTFAAPVRVSADNWMLDGCPENGPALAVDRSRRIHVVWPTLIAGRREPTLALFYATSTDGRRFSARQQIPTEGFPRHPQIAVDARGAITVAWDEQAPGVRRIAVARGMADAAGAVRFIREPIADTASAVYPVVAGVDDAMLVAWTSGPAARSVIRLRRLGLPTP
jgi:hypothetical protein